MECCSEGVVREPNRLNRVNATISEIVDHDIARKTESKVNILQKDKNITNIENSNALIENNERNTQNDRNKTSAEKIDDTLTQKEKVIYEKDNLGEDHKEDQTQKKQKAEDNENIDFKNNNKQDVNIVSCKNLSLVSNKNTGQSFVIASKGKNTLSNLNMEKNNSEKITLRSKENPNRIKKIKMGYSVKNSSVKKTGRANMRNTNNFIIECCERIKKSLRETSESFKILENGRKTLKKESMELMKSSKEKLKAFNGKPKTQEKYGRKLQNSSKYLCGTAKSQFKSNKVFCERMEKVLREITEDQREKNKKECAQR